MEIVFSRKTPIPNPSLYACLRLAGQPAVGRGRELI